MVRHRDIHLLKQSINQPISQSGSRPNLSSNRKKETNNRQMSTYECPDICKEDSNICMLLFPLDINSPRGTYAVVASVSITILFVLLSFINYNMRTCGMKRKDVNTVVRTWDRVIHVLYMIFLCAYEVLSSFGPSVVHKISLTQTPLLFVIWWITCNGMCLIMLIYAMVSQSKFRILTYSVYIIHLTFFTVVCVTRLMFRLIDAGILVLVILLILGSWIMFYVPNVFLLTDDRLLFEENKKHNQYQSLMSPVPLVPTEAHFPQTKDNKDSDRAIVLDFESKLERKSKNNNKGKKTGVGEKKNIMGGNSDDDRVDSDELEEQIKREIYDDKDKTDKNA